MSSTQMQYAPSPAKPRPIASSLSKVAQKPTMTSPPFAATPHSVSPSRNTKEVAVMTSHNFA
eukprot:scaffold340079_cov41-Prasinocladus_malaysianus.AAC.1